MPPLRRWDYPDSACRRVSVGATAGSTFTMVSGVVMGPHSGIVAGVISADEPTCEPGRHQFVRRGRGNPRYDLDAVFRHAVPRAAAHAAGQDQLHPGGLEKRRPSAGFRPRRGDDHPPAHRAFLRVDLEDLEPGGSSIVKGKFVGFGEGDGDFHGKTVDGAGDRRLDWGDGAGHF